MGVFSKILGAGQDKLVKQYAKTVEKINAMEPVIREMDDKEICDRLIAIRREVADTGVDIDDYKVEVYALGREHIRRTTGKRAYDVQLIGALALNDGHIAEMGTGEGKTITTNFPILFNALAGRQVHVFTVNEYLSGRDAEICQNALRGTGVSVGYIYNQQPKASKVQAYACDVIYGTPSEFGFDYLRDNMVTKLDDKVQPHHDYAIIDEIDSILIDEARTPLIISGTGNQNTDIYKAFALAVKHLHPGEDFEMDEAKKTIAPTERGLAKIERELGLDNIYSDNPEYVKGLPRYMKQALTAQFLYHKDKDYIIDNNEVKIVDPNTGRVMEGRRWSEGLHQAIEAKEITSGQTAVEIKQENETLATVTLQNFFRLYTKLSGCTGTAMTEDAEFRKTYGMGVVAVPPNKPIARIDADDVVYKSVDAKFAAIADKVKACNDKGQPVLIGTVSVENSEKLSRLLTKLGIKHRVLNAKNHEKEAHIVAQAGRLGAVTIATNMAGRGTDIILGGNSEELFEAYKAAIISQREPDPVTGVVDDFIPQAELDEAQRQVNAVCEREKELVLEAGGLCVIGSERHESRRIDNQLRGRAGRQGDPGYSQFYISLEDDLMRLFGQEKMDAIKRMMDRGGIDDSMPLDAPIVSKAIETAQHQVESMHYEARKHTLEYDDVLNKQRLAIYSERDLLLEGGDMTEKLIQVKGDVAQDLAFQFCPPAAPSDDWEWDSLRMAYGQLTGHDSEDVTWIYPDAPNMDTTEDVSTSIEWHIEQELDEKEATIGEEQMQSIARQVMLNSVDASWRDHLNYMDYLKSGIGMRSYGQRDPLTEYKDEAYKAFEFMVDSMYQEALTAILRIRIEPATTNTVASPMEPARPNMFDERPRTAVPGAKKPVGSKPIEKALERAQQAQQVQMQAGTQGTASMEGITHTDENVSDDSSNKETDFNVAAATAEYRPKSALEREMEKRAQAKADADAALMQRMNRHKKSKKRERDKVGTQQTFASTQTVGATAGSDADSNQDRGSVQNPSNMVVAAGGVGQSSFDINCDLGDADIVGSDDE